MKDDIKLKIKFVWNRFVLESSNAEVVGGDIIVRLKEGQVRHGCDENVFNLGPRKHWQSLAVGLQGLLCLYQNIKSRSHQSKIQMEGRNSEDTRKKGKMPKKNPSCISEKETPYEDNNSHLIF